jgi:hypothetical protein
MLALGKTIPTVEQLQVAATEACYLKVRPKLDAYWQDRRTKSDRAHEEYLAWTDGH